MKEPTISRLKSLELQGYKTFANRTLFEFAPTVTAIVGPNGSGKSNITDSMRWVLGEQSFSLLRARRSEDMIFSGSEKRSRSGMASATITFDNSDGWLPIDFTEVAITRRAHRDGQNEYRINGQRVRLRDVSELLAHSGLAERTYTVIGQGLVDAALSLKADERRRLFEEAAGIGLYRSRREGALRRLETTHRNLDRVQDILAELSPRLKSLERQARRAGEYEQIRLDLRALLRDWYGYHWNRMQMELTEASSVAQEQEQKLEKSGQDLSEREGETGTLRQRLNSLRSNLNDWHRELAELHTTRETLNRELAVSEERLDSNIRQQNTAKNELTNSGEETVFYQEQLDVVLQDIERLESELQEAVTRSAGAQSALEQRQKERSSIESELQEIQAHLSQLNSHQGKQQARIAESQSQLERSRQALDSALNTLAEVKDERQHAEEDLVAFKQAYERSRLDYEKAGEDLQSQRIEIETIESERKATLEQRSSILAELAGINTQLNVFEQAEKSLTGYRKGTQILIKAAREKRLQGTLGVLSNYLEVPAELERAVSSVLGEFLDAVPLQADPQEALELLEDKGGRAAIIPLADIQTPPDRLKLEKSADVIGIAADFVKVASELRPVVELLLGQVVIVRNRSAARRVLRKQPHSLRVVTTRGEVFFASGPILCSGDGDLSGDQTLLGRARQRREAQQKQETLKDEVSTLDERLGKIRGQLERLQQAEQDHITRTKSARRALDEANTALSRSEATLQGLEKQVHWQHEQETSLQSDIKQVEKQALKLSSELVDLNQKLDEVRQVFAQKSQALVSLTLDEFQSQVAHWNTLYAVSENSLNDARTRREERANTLHKIEERRVILHTRLDELAKDIEEIEQNLDSKKQAQSQVQNRIKEIQTLIDPGEQELNTAEQQQQQQQELESSTRQALSSAEHFHAQARISLAKRHQSLETLQHRIEDDFGLVTFDYVEQVSGPNPLPFDGMVEELPFLEELSPGIEETIKRKRAQLRRMGAINPQAQAEYQEVDERFQFLTSQMTDLKSAEEDVRQVIRELDEIMEREFQRTFDLVADVFKETFVRLFGGGSARLVLTDPNDLTSSGIDIEARLPGRRSQGLALLSGGERSLTATALIFSLLKISPTPFCVLDEVDAMLDDVNVGRFGELLRELSQNTQFVIVTHNRTTVQVADIIYGVTMGRDSASQVLSIKLDQVAEVIKD